ncbi:MAG: bifunctional adenosylcobinamide kinase/adenosylcobinamide-phosphate guanylyltransferase [Spirochaetales bacterium]|nr:bifunctional adenosylcobinamide kinase/adenosylcobinamide-phosphate guanylyltransferase [Spirochaetales bacterium]
MDNQKSHTVLILGGVRSGKSDAALKLAAKMAGTKQNVVFIATGTAQDDEMKERIENHKKQRPPGWTTIEAQRECGRQLSGLKTKADVVILDCLTMLVANFLMEGHDADDETLLETKIIEELHSFFHVCKERGAACILVSNEVGMGVVPPSKMGRVYRDLLGKANKYAAAAADKVLLMVAGLAVDIKKLSVDL